jgi:hypothetical protein
VSRPWDEGAGVDCFSGQGGADKCHGVPFGLLADAGAS